jgi:hypothetical protein
VQRHVDRADLLDHDRADLGDELTTVTLTVWSLVVTVAWPLDGEYVGGLNCPARRVGRQVGSSRCRSCRSADRDRLRCPGAQLATVPFFTLSHHPHRCS